MDLTQPVQYRGFTLNDPDIMLNSVPGVGAGAGLIGCVIDSVQMSDVDVVQFMEKRSQQDGMDAGQPFLGTRRIRMAGTLYNVSRADLYDDLSALRAALSPVLAAREEPLDFGYRPLTFIQPTASEDWPGGFIPLQVKAMPRSFDGMFGRDNLGGEATDALAIPWQATFVCRDPSIMALEPVDIEYGTQSIVVATGTAATNLINKTAHGLVNGSRVRFTTLTDGTGLNTTTTYFVISSGLTADAFKVSATFNGAEVDITVNYTVANYVVSLTTAGTLTNRGNYISPVNGLWVVGASSGVIAGTVGDSTFSIAVPASTGSRIIRFKGEDKVVTIEEDDIELPRMDVITFSNDTTWPSIVAGDSAYSVTVHGCVLETGSHMWFYERWA